MFDRVYQEQITYLIISSHSYKHFHTSILVKCSNYWHTFLNEFMSLNQYFPPTCAFVRSVVLKELIGRSTVGSCCDPALYRDLCIYLVIHATKQKNN